MYSAAALGACTEGTLDNGSGQFLLGRAPRACWPLAVPILLTIPCTFVGPAACTRGNATEAFALQVLKLHAQRGALAGVALAGLTKDQAAAQSARLMTLVTCDGRPLVSQVGPCIAGVPHMCMLLSGAKHAPSAAAVVPPVPLGVQR